MYLRNLKNNTTLYLNAWNFNKCAKTKSYESSKRHKMIINNLRMDKEDLDFLAKCYQNCHLVLKVEMNWTKRDLISYQREKTWTKFKIKINKSSESWIISPCKDKSWKDWLVKLAVPSWLLCIPVYFLPEVSMRMKRDISGKIWF